MKSLRILYFIVCVLICTCTSQTEISEQKINDIAISSDGVEISFDKQGKGKPALVFVHGWCCDKSYWDFQVPHFSKQHQVVTIDLAGHGESGLNRQNWTIESFGQDVVAVIEKLNLDQVILIGHSMGGPVNIEVAKQIPKRIIGLVGVDTYHNFETEYTPEQIDGYLSSFKADFVESSNNLVRGMFQSNADSTLVEQIVKDMSSAPEKVAIGALQGFLTFDRVGALEEIQIPIYCINAEQPFTNIEVGQRNTVSFEVKLMQGVGHFVMMEDPEKFNQLLTETVKELSL